MGRLSRFEIVFEKPVYFAGETMVGAVEIKLTDSMKMKEISIRFVGEARVEWIETKNNRNGLKCVNHASYEGYFNHKIQLWHQEVANCNKLRTGDHSFPFRFFLPLHVPTSFEGSTGHVRYQAEAIIDIPWSFNKKCKVPFSVNAVYDLNRMEAAMHPVTNHAETYICCWCCRSGPITAQAMINRRGYVPGEILRLNAEVSNFSNRDVNSTKVIFMAVITYHAKKKSRTEVREISRFKRPSIKPGCVDAIFDEAIPIPSIPPSQLIGCSIIDIEYRITICVTPSAYSDGFKFSLPVLIGTIPLRTAQINQPTTLPLPSAPHEYDLSPPPSYADCVFGTADIRETDDTHTHGKLNYTPLYVYYNNNNS